MIMNLKLVIPLRGSLEAREANTIIYEKVWFIKKISKHLKRTFTQI